MRRPQRDSKCGTNILKTGYLRRVMDSQIDALEKSLISKNEMFLRRLLQHAKFTKLSNKKFDLR